MLQGHHMQTDWLHTSQRPAPLLALVPAPALALAPAKALQKQPLGRVKSDQV